jgi:hypothetical protein
MDALRYLCVRCPHPPRLDVCAVTGLWAERGGDVRVQGSTQQRSDGHAAHRARQPGRAGNTVRAPPSPIARRHGAVTGLWAERGGDVGCRSLSSNDLMGTLPTELGTLTALADLCVRRPRPPRLDACAVTGLWAERGGGVGVQEAIRERSHGAAAHRAGHHGHAGRAVRAPPSPTAPGRVSRHRVVG